MAKMGRGKASGVPQWSAPGVECHTCGVECTPVAVRMTVAVPWFWSMPDHPAFMGTAPGSCAGSGRLLGPVAGLSVVP